MQLGCPLPTVLCLLHALLLHSSAGALLPHCFDPKYAQNWGLKFLYSSELWSLDLLFLYWFNFAFCWLFKNLLNTDASRHFGRALWGGSVNTADPTGLVCLEYIKEKAQWSIYPRKWTASWRLKKWLKNMRRTLTMLISEQDKPWCYAVGTQLCVVAFRGQIPAFLLHAAFTDKQSWILACGRH